MGRPAPRPLPPRRHGDERSQASLLDLLTPEQCDRLVMAAWAHVERIQAASLADCKGTAGTSGRISS